MQRRRFLASASAVAAGLVAGCLAGGDGKTTTVNGETIRLMPVDTTYEWHQDESARFVDARGITQYERSHITGAVSSPANTAGSSDDPVMDWPTDTRIVCYCGCPHHLSSIRAAHLQQNGYTDVQVIDEGFFEWVDRGYPVTGSASNAYYEITGRTDPAYAGEMVWVRDVARDQLEAAPIRSDGSYTVHVRFSGLTEESVLSLETPTYTLERPLAALVDGVVTGPTDE
ncbi:rhodanese-like domain-containing protein [Haloarchaeobius sp. HRN-SO-5]|uniref:rhodanese-like domain-containing protein n=1 Tax=Haloarchaeobius sp. HRN-SO-5 TaxID=3446118 RepID=UPI003EBA81EF